MPREQLAEPLLHVVGDVVVGAVGQHLEDADQLVVGVVGELDGGAEPAGQPGVLGDEEGHRLGVARHDHDQVVAPVLHLLDQGVDRLGAVLVAGQAVGLVDEEHAADGGLDHLGGLHRGLAEVAGHQLGPVDLDQLALGEQAERPVDARHQPGDGGLAGAGVADEDQVPGDRRDLEPGVLAQALDPEHRDLAVDLGLDGRPARRARRARPAAPRGSSVAAPGPSADRWPRAARRAPPGSAGPNGR